MDKKEKKSLKERWEESKAHKFFKDHPDASLTLIGGLLSIIGGVIKLACYNKEYEESVYLTTQDDEIYKIPARPCKTSKKVTSKSVTE